MQSTLQSCDTKRLEAFHTRFQRQILRIRWSDFISNAAVTACTQLSPISDRPTIVHRRLGLFGHVARLNNGIPVRDTLYCALARRTEIRPPNGWKRPSFRSGRVWVQQIDNDSVSGIRRILYQATSRVHPTRSALQASDVHAF